MVFSLVNPILEAVKDELHLNDLFRKYDIIPYYGTQNESSHSMLQLISDLTELSPSHAACKNAVKTWAFGSGVEIIPTRTARKREDEESLLSESEKSQFEELLFSIGIDLSAVIDHTEVIFDNYSDTGNAYVLIRLSRVNSTWNVKIEPIHPKNAAYLRSKRGTANRIVNTPYWSEDFWAKKKPFLAFGSDIRSDFVWNRKRNGDVLETIVHIKRKADASPYYGRPAILSVLESLYVEHAGKQKDCKVAGTELISKMILAMEEPPPNRKVVKRKTGKEGVYNHDLDSASYKLRQLTTNEGEKARTIALMNYPSGAQPPTPIPLEVNRDHQFDKHMVDKHASAIYSIWDWDRQLTGATPAKANIGGNIILDLFTVKNTSVVTPNQRFYENIWGRIFTEIGKITNPGETMRTIKFPNLIDELVDRLSSLKNGSQNQNLSNGNEEDNTATE